MTGLARSVLKRVAGTPPAPTAIEEKEKTPIAIPGEAEERQAKRASVRRQTKRRGRKSTILTALSDDKLGG